MKILVVSHRVPYPLKDGGVIAMHSLLHGLKSAGAQVKLLCLNPKKDGVDATKIPQYFYDDFGFEAVENRTHVHDIHATILHLMGLDHERLTYFHQGRNESLTDVHGNVIKDVLA